MRCHLLLLLLFLTGCAAAPLPNIKVTSLPAGADIYVDGRAVGKTPAAILVDFPENHQLVREKKLLTLRLSGYKEQRQVIGYSAEAERLFNFQLIPEPGTDTGPEPISEPAVKTDPEPNGQQPASSSVK